MEDTDLMKSTIVRKCEGLLPSTVLSSSASCAVMLSYWRLSRCTGSIFFSTESVVAMHPDTVSFLHAGKRSPHAIKPFKVTLISYISVCTAKVSG